jgi:hypothetical protein
MGRHERAARRKQALVPNVESFEQRIVLSTVTPTSITLPITLPGGGIKQNVSITLPEGSIGNKADIVLLLDDTGSFASFSQTVRDIFANLVTSLQTALPGVSFGFGVTRFEDYGGPGTGYSGEDAEGRPFILNQPVVTAATAGGETQLLNLITTALNNEAAGFGGDGPESGLEALYQIATGLGFDGNGNGTTTDSGAAGSIEAQTMPGTSGDVPAFSTNVLPTSGTLGGVGWRPDAIKIVLLATDIGTVTAFAYPGAIPTDITAANGVTQPTSAFDANGRFGYVGDAKSENDNTVPNAVAPLGAATLPGTIAALNALGIQVLGMGPGAAPTSDPGPSGDESVYLSALGRLTGGVDAMGNPLVFSTSVSNEVLTQAIVNAITASLNKPVDIGLRGAGLPEGLMMMPTDPVLGVEPGGTASFMAMFTAEGPIPPGTYALEFFALGSGAVLGTIPVFVQPSLGPEVIGGQEGVVRVGVHMQPTRLLMQFSESMNPTSMVITNVTVYARGHDGRLGTADDIPLRIASTTYDPEFRTLEVRMRHRLRLHGQYLLVLNGQSPDGMRNVQGIFLNGDGTGPGTDFVTTITKDNWPGLEPRPDSKPVEQPVRPRRALRLAKLGK